MRKTRWTGKTSYRSKTSKASKMFKEVQNGKAQKPTWEREVLLYFELIKNLSNKMSQENIGFGYFSK